VALVQRDGAVKSKPIIRLTTKNLKSFVTENVDKKAIIMTDDFCDGIKERRQK